MSERRKILLGEIDGGLKECHETISILTKCAECVELGEKIEKKFDKNLSISYSNMNADDLKEIMELRR